MTGVKLMTPQQLDYFAIDNDGTTADNPGVWDGFTLAEKWMMLSSGLARKTSNITDASMVIGGGPISLASGDTAKFTFSIFAGKTLDDLRNAAQTSIETAIQTGVNENPITQTTNPDVLNIFPNPVTKGNLNIALTLNASVTSRLEVVDVLGQTVLGIFDNRQFAAGETRNIIQSVSGLTQGRYILKFTTQNGVYCKPFIVLN